MDIMAEYMARRLMKRKTDSGLSSAQQMYRGYFINTTLYINYKADVDTILTTEGHSDIIVAA